MSGPQRTRLAAERGQSVGEYVVLLTLVAALAAGAAFTDTGRNVVASMSGAVLHGFCVVAQAAGYDGDCSGGPLAGGSADEAFRPERCDILASDTAGGLRLDVLFFDIQGDLTFSRTERSDGTTEFSVVDRVGGGVAAEAPGAQVELGPVLEIDVGAEARVGVAVRDGHSWVVPSDDADDFQRKLIRATATDQTVGRFGPVGRFVSDQFNERVLDVPPPNIFFDAFDLEAQLSASAEASAFGETLAGAEVGAEGMLQLGVERDRSSEDEREWTNTTHLLADVSATGELGVIGAKLEGEIGVSSIIKVERGLDGELRSIELTTTTTGDLTGSLGIDDDLATLLAGATTQDSLVETTVIDLDTPEARDVASRFLRRGGLDGGGLADLAHQQGRTSLTLHRGEEFSIAAGGKVAFVAKAGLRGEGSHGTTHVVDSHFLGAPDAAGNRPLLPYTDCIRPAA